MKRVREWPVDDNTSEGELLQRAGQRVDAEDRVKRADEAVREAIAMMRDHHGKAKCRIAELPRYTSAITDACEREFMQLPEEMRRIHD